MRQIIMYTFITKTPPSFDSMKSVFFFLEKEEEFFYLLVLDLFYEAPWKDGKKLIEKLGKEKKSLKYAQKRGQSDVIYGNYQCFPSLLAVWQ